MARFRREINLFVEVRGHFTVPDFLSEWTSEGFTGHHIRRDAARKPQAMGSRNPSFWVRIPYSATDGKSTPHGLVLYGHGLLGSGTQVRGGFNGRIANRKNLIFFAADLTGMSEADQPSVVQILAEVSRFPHLADGTLGYSPNLCHGVTGKGLNGYDAIFRTLAGVGYRGCIAVPGDERLSPLGARADNLALFDDRTGAAIGSSVRWAPRSRRR